MNNEGWEILADRERNAVWDRIYDQLEFNPSVLPDDFPGFKEPSPSITYSIAEIYGDDFEVFDRDLHNKALRIFKQVADSDGYLLALVWQHDCYKFFPHKCALTADSEQWPIMAVPNGDYYLFVDRKLRFGWLSHPWEQTICIFGKPMLAALKQNRPTIFRNPERMKDDF